MAATELQRDIEEHLGISLPLEFPHLFERYARRAKLYSKSEPATDLEALFFLECETERQRFQLELEREGSSRTLFSKRTVTRILERIAKRVKREDRKEHRYLPLELEPAVEPPKNIFQELIEGLAPDQMVILDQYFVVGRTLEEIAELTGSSSATVFRRLQSALARLRGKLS